MNVYQRYLAKGDKTYYGRFQFRGKPVLRNLGTEVKADAERRLRKLYAEFQAGRFEVLDETSLRPNLATIADIIAAFRLYASPRLEEVTIKGYVNSLRYIITTVHGAVPPPDDRPSSVLTADLVLKFQNAILTAAGKDCATQDRARVNANSFVRQARAIVGKKARATYRTLTLPDLTGFIEATPLREPTQSYRVKPAALIDATRCALEATRETDPNVYRAFLLALGAGLRRKEASHARHAWLREFISADGAARYALDVGITSDFRPKGKDARTIPIEKFVYDELRALRPNVADAAAPDYIIEGSHNERTEEVWERIAGIMKGLGWQTDKKAHELRKIFGSEVATKFGLFAAQKLLGHKKPDTTSRSYANLVSLPDLAILRPAAPVVTAPVKPAVVARVDLPAFGRN